MVTTFDYCLLGFLWPRIREFTTGHLWFRLCYGFQKTEIIIHAPTAKELEKLLFLPPVNIKQAQATNCDATNCDFILENIGLNTRRQPWELCYAAPSMDAHRLADDGSFDLKNWELSVWQKDGYHQWKVWEIWRHQNPVVCAMAVELMKACLFPPTFEDPRS